MRDPKEFFLKCPTPSCKGHCFVASEPFFDHEYVRCPDCTYTQSFRAVLDRYRLALGVAVTALNKIHSNEYADPDEIAENALKEIQEGKL